MACLRFLIAVVVVGQACASVHEECVADWYRIDADASVLLQVRSGRSHPTFGEGGSHDSCQGMACLRPLIAAVVVGQARQITKTVSGRFYPTFGEGGKMKASVLTEPVCTEDYYHPSDLEMFFASNVSGHTSSKDELCAALKSHGAQNWVAENLGEAVPETRLFSTMCVKGHFPALVEPLAGILRDPRFFCKDLAGAAGSEAATASGMLSPHHAEFSVDWIVTADSPVLANYPGEFSGKKRFYDAGGTHFADATMWFVNEYRRRGIVFDEVYVWEAESQPKGNYYKGVPTEEREFWESRVKFYNGVPVSSDKGHDDNVVERIFRECSAEDFCAFKLDIDTPSVELPLVKQLLESPQKTRTSLNEFFFEHHVHGLMQSAGWGSKVNGTFNDSYSIFTQLRQMGVRAHSWI